MAERINGCRDPVQEDHRKVSANSYDSDYVTKPPTNIRKKERKELLQKKLYLYPLKDNHTEEELNNIFSKFGEVTEVYIDTRKHQWAFVSMKTQAAAERALKELNGHPQHEFGVQYAKEKLPESAAATPSQTASPAEANYRNSEAAPQTGSQFINSFKGKSLPKRTVPESSQRPNVNITYKRIVTDENISSPLPNCFYCKRQTFETCLKCHQPFCSKDCMIHGYNGHTDQCVVVPRHSLELKNQPGAMPTMNGVLYTDVFPTISQDFADTSRSYLDHSRNSTINVNNSYEAENIEELGVSKEVKNLRDLRYRSPAQHRMKDKKQSRHPSSTNAGTEDEDAYNDFSNATGGRKNHHAKKENEKIKYSNKENESSCDERSSYAKRERDSKFNNSIKENDSLRNEHSNKENDSSWPNQSGVSENRFGKENESSRENQSRVRHRLKKEKEIPWDNEAPVSGQISKDEEPTWNNEDYEHSQKKDNESSRNKSSSSGSRPKKESAASRIRSSKENALSRKNRSGNRSSNEKMSDDEVSSKRRWDSQERDDRPRELENRRNFDTSPRSPPTSHSSQTPLSPQRSKCNSPHQSNPEFLPLPRAEIRNNAKFEIKLVQKDPYAVLLIQERNVLNHMLDALQKFNLEPMEKFERGIKCVAQKDGKWCRCIICDSDSMLVKFIDFMHKPVPIQKERIRKLPEEFSSIPPFCYRVNFLNAQNYEVDEFMDSKFDVEFVSKEQGTWNVNLIKKSFDEELTEARCSRDARKQSKSPKRSYSSNRDYSDLRIVLKKDMPVQVCVTYIDTESKKIFVTIFDKSQKLMDMITNINPTSLPVIKEPRLNCMCLALFEGCWGRARIVSVDPLKVYYIDFGNAELAQKNDLRMSPGDFARIDPLAVAVKFRGKSISSNSENEIIDIIPIEEVIAEKLWVVRLASEPEIVEKRSPVLESPIERNAPEVALDAILKVYVTHKISSTEYYVGLEKERSQLLLVEIQNDEVRKMKCLKTPSLGKPCLAMFESYWCRAKIVELEPLIVFFIDYGNEEKAELENLYPMPEKYLNIPPLAFKIQLREPKEIESYMFFHIRKVSEKLWSVEPPCPPKINANVS